MWFCVHDATAQSNLDSLLLIWQDTSNSGRDRADAFEDFIRQGVFFTNPDSAIILGKELVDFTGKIQYEIAHIDASVLLGYTYFRTGDYSNALTTYRDGLQVAERLEDSLGIARLNLRMGFLYHDNDDLITALKHYQRALYLYEMLDNADGMGSVFNEFGSIYRSRGDYDKSLEYYLKSIAINDSLGDYSGNSAIYNNIGRLYLDQGRLDDAMESFEKSLAIDQDRGDKLGIASCLAGIGAVYQEQDAEQQAIDFFQRSLAISESIDDLQGACASMLSLSDIFLDQGRHREAIRYCLKVKNVGEELGDIGHQQAACDCLYDAYKELGNSRQALIFLERSQILYDSMQFESTAMQLQQMEFSKQATIDSLARVEQAIQVELAHQKEVQLKDRNRNLAIGAGIFFLLLAGGFYNLWHFARKSKAIIEKEKERSEHLLLNILPAEIAAELKEKGEAAARDFDMVSILFTDFKEFTEKASTLTATELIDEINHCFKAFDQICEKYQIEKIKTIGDAYMAAGGLPMESNDSVQNTILAALDMQAFMKNRVQQNLVDAKVAFEMRVGIHTGPVVAGIVGVKKFQYDVWGDTVNTASRMESSGVVGEVNISDRTHQYVRENPQFSFERRQPLSVKGKGEMTMWFVRRIQLE